MKAVDKVIGKVALPIIAVAGFLLIIAVVFSSQGTNNENNAYIRVINCILSKNAATRQQEDIESCYQTVEKESHISLQRYDGNTNR